MSTNTPASIRTSIPKNFSTVEERVEARAHTSAHGHLMDEWLFDECNCVHCGMNLQLIPGSRMRGQALVDPCPGPKKNQPEKEPVSTDLPLKLAGQNIPSQPMPAAHCIRCGAPYPFSDASATTRLYCPACRRGRLGALAGALAVLLLCGALLWLARGVSLDAGHGWNQIAPSSMWVR